MTIRASDLLGLNPAISFNSLIPQDNLVIPADQELRNRRPVKNISHQFFTASKGLFCAFTFRDVTNACYGADALP